MPMVQEVAISSKIQSMPMVQKCDIVKLLAIFNLYFLAKKDLWTSSLQCKKFDQPLDILLANTRKLFARQHFLDSIICRYFYLAQIRDWKAELIPASVRAAGNGRGAASLGPSREAGGGPAGGAPASRGGEEAGGAWGGARPRGQGRRGNGAGRAELGAAAGAGVGAGDGAGVGAGAWGGGRWTRRRMRAWRIQRRRA